MKTQSTKWAEIFANNMTNEGLIFIFYILSYLLLKTMGCFSGRLMSSASNQKLFCGVCSAFKCSFDEFVGEKVVSPSQSSTILAPPQWLIFKIYKQQIQLSIEKKNPPSVHLTLLFLPSLSLTIYIYLCWPISSLDYKPHETRDIFFTIY